MTNAARLTALLAIVTSSVTADRQSTLSSKLQIHIPSSLRSSKDAGFDHREAFFGNPPYGGSISQQLVYADSTLCNSMVDTSGGFPRREVDPFTGRMTPWETPFLLMVDRGGCTFVTKVRHAQRVGAAGVVIADNTCLCDFLEVCTVEEGQECEDQEPMMGNDGSGQDITIPSFLMLKHEADPIKEALRQDTYVQMEMSWVLPKKDVVEYTVLTTAGDPLTRRMEEQFGAAVALFGSKAQFTPHFNIKDGMEFGCRPTSNPGCSSLCTNAGRYCVRGLSGSDVVAESLRRICIWKIYGTDGIGIPYWRYVKASSERCFDGREEDEEAISFSDRGCMEAAMEDAGVEADEVAQCMKDSGGLEGDQRNVWLEEEANTDLTYGVVVWPAMFVNGKPIRGLLSFEVAFEAICAGFSTGRVPEVCAECNFCPRGIYNCVQSSGVCDDEEFIIFPDEKEDFAYEDEVLWYDGPPDEGPPDGDWDDGSRHKDRSHLFANLAVSFVFVIFGLVAFIHFKRSRRLVRDQVRGILSEYMQVDSLGVEESPANSMSNQAPSSFIPFDYQQMEETSNSQTT